MIPDEADDLIFAWHVHHDILIAVLTEPIEYRRAYITNYKPMQEHELRLRLLQTVPSHLVPADLVAAWHTLNSAMSKWASTLSSVNTQLYNIARQEYSDILQGATLSELHDRLCPDCPWDGRTIFSGIYDTR